MAYAFEWGKCQTCHLKRKIRRKWAKGLKSYDSEKKWTAGTGLTPSLGNIHVYHNNIQRSSSLYEGTSALQKHADAKIQQIFSHKNENISGKVMVFPLFLLKT